MWNILELLWQLWLMLKTNHATNSIPVEFLKKKATETADLIRTQPLSSENSAELWRITRLTVIAINHP